LIDYDEVRLCLRTTVTNGPIVHPPGDMSMENHGDDDDDAGRRKLPTRPPELSGSPTSRDIWGK
jgi:hypothetical protein